MEKYFAAANSGNGFVSWFADIFDPKELTKTYIIKGGSGTGKSTLIKNAAERAMKKGAVCELFLCSADPGSADGVIMYMPDGRRLAMLDGTAPHTTDPVLPGVLDEIVNLGSYWCDDMLGAYKDSAVKLAEKKKRLYKEAYSRLLFCGEVYRYAVGQARELLLSEKLKGAVHRLLAGRIKETKPSLLGGKRRIRGLCGISASGITHLDSFEGCERVYAINDGFDLAPFVFEAMEAEAVRLGLSYDISPNPLVPEFTEAIRFPELSLAVVSTAYRSDVKPLNLVRFCDRELAAVSDRTRRRNMKRACSEVTDAAVETFTGIRRVHGELEEIYKRAMDFSLLEDAAGGLMAKMGI